MAEVCEYFEMEKPDVLRMWRSIDSNRDGYIDFTEFLTAAFDKKKLLSEENLKRAFAVFDKDGDGTISKEEIRSILGGDSGESLKSQVKENSSGSGVTEDFWADLVASVDQDDDGKISYQEFHDNMCSILNKRASWKKISKAEEAQH